MRLRHMRVQNFKCIEDSDEFSLDDITCLVGKNESGKTALLQALYKLKPDVDTQANFDPTNDYPRRRLIDYEEQLASGAVTGPANVLTTTWELGPEDIGAVQDLLGPNALASTSVTVEKGYANVRRWRFEYDEQVVVDHYRQMQALTTADQTYLQEAATIPGLLLRLNENATRTPGQTALLATLQQRFPNGDAKATVEAVLDSRLPTFLYFANYQRMPGQVALNTLQTDLNDPSKRDGLRVFQALLRLANTSPEAINSIPRFEQLRARLEAVSSRISSEIFGYWTQISYL